jgi:hypothetical protein
MSSQSVTEAAAVYSQKAALLAGYSILCRPEIRADIFLILQGREATTAAVKAAQEAAALYSQYTSRAAQLAATAAYDKATEATQEAEGFILPVIHRAIYRKDTAKYGLIRKAARIANTSTEAALNALYSTHSISKRDYTQAAQRAAHKQPQRAAIQGRINAYLAAQAKAATGRTSQAGISRTGGLYKAKSSQDSRRRINLNVYGFGVRSIPIKKAAYCGLNNIQSVAAILGSENTPPILAAREAAISREAAQHIKAAAVVITD